MSFAFLPLYTGDYLRDTQHLSCSEHGIYLKLIMHCWDQKGPAPLDERKLCGIVNARSSDEIEALRRVLSEFFIRTDDGYYNKRINEEVTRAEVLSGARSEAGKKGGQARAKQLPGSSQAIAKQQSLPPPPPPPPHSYLPQKSEIQVPTVLVDEASPPRPPACPTQEILKLYHQHLKTLSRVDILTDNRRKHLAARWRELLEDKEIGGAADPRAAGLEWWGWFFQHVASSKFLTGRVKTWRATFDWLILPSNFAKVIEGHYHREGATE